MKWNHWTLQKCSFCQMLTSIFSKGGRHFTGMQTVNDERGEGSKIEEICQQLKVKTLWQGHKFWKNLPPVLTIQLFLLSSVKPSGRFYQIFVAFSEKLDFKWMVPLGMHNVVQPNTGIPRIVWFFGPQQTALFEKPH